MFVANIKNTQSDIPAQHYIHASLLQWQYIHPLLKRDYLYAFLQTKLV